MGRIVVVTGARQTGKTTLVRATFPRLAYVSVEDPTLRPIYSRMSAAEWIERYPRAIVDEVQKTPSLVETIKAAYDADAGVRYVLLGSSQIQLLSRVKETLAGRVAIEELWPLTLPEMATSSWADPVRPSRLVTWLQAKRPDDRVLLDDVPAASRAFARDAALFDRYTRFGGMPALTDPGLDDDAREEWLHDYQRTYLERDVADLASLRDLEPFVLAQRAIAGRTGRIINFSDLSRAAGVAPSTAQRFLRYLEISYQVIHLQPYFRNEEKRLAKSPKVHFVDPGVLRAVLGRRGEPTGEEYESAVIAEVWKQVRNARLRVNAYHLRTHDGREVDLLLERDDGFVAVEVKQGAHVGDADARHLRGLESLLDKPLLGALLLSQDRDARRLHGGVIALPAAWALSPTEVK